MTNPTTQTTKLSDRVRAGSECAPWVLIEIEKLENANDIICKNNYTLCDGLKEIEELDRSGATVLVGECATIAKRTLAYVET